MENSLLIPTIVWERDSIRLEQLPLITDPSEDVSTAAETLLNQLGWAGSVLLMAGLVSNQLDQLHRLFDEETRGTDPDSEKVKQLQMVEQVLIGFEGFKAELTAQLTAIPDIQLCTLTMDSPAS